MIVDTAAEAVNLGEVIGEREKRVLLVKIGNDRINCRWDFEEERVVDETDITIERKLKSK